MYKISVILPVFNVAPYLEESLDCLINQTLKDIEIICVDDGSTDNSIDIIKSFLKKDNRIKLLINEHSFAGGARNAGLKVASGEYIMFLDPDDYYDRVMCEELYNIIVDHKTDMTICGVYNVEKKTKKYLPPSYKKYINDFFNNKIFSVKDLKDDIWFFLVYPYNKIYRKNFLLESQIKFQVLKNTNDASFAYETLIAAKSISLVNKAYYYYRRYRPNNTRLTKGKSLDCVLNAYEYSFNVCNKYSVFDNVKVGFYTVIISSLLWHLNTYCKEFTKENVFFYNSVKTFIESKYNLYPDISNYLKRYNFFYYCLSHLVLKNDLNDYLHLFVNRKYNKIILKGNSITKSFYKLPYYRHSFKDNKEKYYFLGIPFFKYKYANNQLFKYLLGCKIYQQSCICINDSVKTYVNYIYNRTNSDLVYIINEHIGETFILISRLKELLALDKKSKVSLVLRNEIQYQVVDLFANYNFIENIIVVPTSRNIKVEVGLFFDKPRVFRGKKFRVLMPEAFWRQKDVQYKHYLQRINYFLGLKNSRLYFVPNTTKSDVVSLIEKAKSHGLDINNFVFLSPESISVKPISVEFWKTLSIRLFEMGYDVYVNITNINFNIDREKVFKTSIKEAYLLAGMSKCIISMRSGLFELIVSSHSSPSICLYNGDNRLIRNSLKKIEGLDYPYLIEVDWKKGIDISSIAEMVKDLIVQNTREKGQLER